MPFRKNNSCSFIFYDFFITKGKQNACGMEIFLTLHGFFVKQDVLHHKYSTFCTFNLKLHIINENC